MSARRLIGVGLGVLGAVAIAGCGGSAARPARSVPARPARAGRTAVSSEGGLAASTQSLPAALSRPPSVTTPVGPPPRRLVVHNLITGKGEVARPGDQVTVHYVGVLYKNGKVFDSSWVNGQAYTTDLANGSAISGLVMGIVGERVGGRREVIIPPNLAYGASGSPPKIPPHATLIYDIDLVRVSENVGDD